jgi:hypothetical protein
MESSVFGLVDHAHPTAAELLDDAVVRDGLANQGRLAICAIILGAKSWQVNESGSLVRLAASAACKKGKGSVRGHHPGHGKPTSKGVSQAVPGKVPDPSIRHGGTEPMLVTPPRHRGDTNKNATCSREAAEQFLKRGESDRVEGNVPCVSLAAVLLPSYKPVLAGLAAIAMGCASCGRLPLVPAVVNVLDSPFPIATTAAPVLHCRMHCRAQIKQSSQRQGQCP